MPEITDYDMKWDGRQTIENTPAIAARLEHMLRGKRFTLASTHDGFPPENESGFNVRAGLRVKEGTFACTTGEDETEPFFPWAHFSFRYTPTGGYGYWGIETRAQDWMKAGSVKKAFEYPYWKFDRDSSQARVAHRMPSGALVVDVFAIEQEDEDIHAG